MKGILTALSTGCSALGAGIIVLLSLCSPVLLGATVWPTPVGSLPEERVDIGRSMLSDLNGLLPITICGCSSCGYVTQSGELGYEIYMWDFVHVCHGGVHQDTIKYVGWELFGDGLGPPTYCMGTLAYCGHTTHYVTGCDLDATFYVYYYDENWNVIHEYGFDNNQISYQYGDCNY